MPDENKYVGLINNINKLAGKDYEKIKEKVSLSSELTTTGSIDSNAFDKYIVINKNISDHNSEEFKQIRGRMGVYVFKMIEDYDVPENFNMFLYCANQNDIHIKKFCKNKTLYVGKTYKAIERVHQHYSTEYSNPYSLKLGYESRTELNEKCIMFIFFLKKELKEYHDIILPAIEKQLHEKMKPYTGSPRL